MKGDFTSFRNGHHKGYTGVLRQQGRVDLDADWNEYVGIQEHLRRTIEKDVIGACGVPRHGGGFAVGLGAGGGDLTISPGRIYVDGILCELEGESSYLGQPNYPGRPALNPVDGRTDLIYLDVWQRHVTAVEDPAIREKALGGPDTTTRLQTVWQVKVLEGVGEVGCADEIQGWPPAPGTGRLSTQEKTAAAPEDPCLIAPGGGYRGLENRLYRVEIHRGSEPAGPPTFKWSRDNGSVVFPIEEFVSGEPTKVIVSRLGRDQVLALREGDWVEVAGDDPELDGEPGLLTRIEEIDRARRELTLAGDVSSVAGQEHPKVRRWDQTETDDTTGLDEGARPIREDEWLDLEDGAQICFKPGETYKSGDYWVFTARTATGKVERLVEAEPRGVDHHYCRLALVTWSEGADGTVAAEVQDCRKEFPPLIELPTGGASCCTVTVGDGVRSKGNFTDIQAAVDAVQGPGRVCILPGEYRLAKPVVIRGRGLVVSGCGIQTRIVGPEDGPAFQIEDSLGIWLRSLYIESRSGPGAIVVTDSNLVYVKDCFVSRRQLFPEAPERVDVRRLIATERIPRARLPQDDGETGPALTVSGGSHVVVADNYFLAGRPSLSIQAQDVRIARSVIRGAGGVWIRDGSSEVLVEDNEIGEGQGPGIKLGGLAEGEASPRAATGVTGVDIVGNRIFSMEESGIDAGAEETPDDTVKGLGDVEDVTIARNSIVGCARKKRRVSSEFEAAGGIVLSDTSRVLVHENYIAENGEGPACGVFAYTCQSLEVTDNTIVDNGTTLGGEPQQQCIDFREMDPGEGDNPRIEQNMTFTVFSFDGNRLDQTHVVNWGGLTGLNCAFQTEIDLPAPTRLVELTLATFAGSATIEALDASGGAVARQEVRDDVGSQPQSFALGDGEISKVVIRARQNEVLLHEFCSGEQQSGFQGGIVGLFVTDVSPDEIRDRSPEGRRLFRTGAPAARIHDNIVVTPQGHALMLIVAGPVSVADNSFTSRGIGRQPEFLGRLQEGAGQLAPVLQGGACVFVYNVGRAPLLPGAFSRLGSATNVHAERMFRPTEGTLGLAAAVSDRLLPDGRVLFHGNQVTLEAANIAPEPDFTIRAVAGVPRLNPGAVVLFSFDDVSLQDNQVIAEIAGGVVFFNAAAVAPTVRASGNRFSEVPLAFYSCVSWGQKNNTTGNQATHCILALGTDVLEEHNQILFITALCADLERAEGRTDG